MVSSVLDYGVLAPHARWRSQVVRYDRATPVVNTRTPDASPFAAGTWAVGPGPR